MRLGYGVLGAALALAVVLGTANAAWADWAIKYGEDPMTNRKWAAASATFNGGQELIFKCWTNGYFLLGVVGVGIINDAASHKENVQVRFRIDKDEIIEGTLHPTNINGALVLSADGDVNMLTLIKRIGEAKQRVVMAIGDAVVETSARGSANAVAAMHSTCGLTYQKAHDQAIGAKP
jgi:hypothetical protein